MLEGQGSLTSDLSWVGHTVYLGPASGALQLLRHV